MRLSFEGSSVPRCSGTYILQHSSSFGPLLFPMPLPCVGYSKNHIWVSSVRIYHLNHKDTATNGMYVGA